MQFPPLNLTDVSLLLAIGAITLLIAAEVFSSSDGLTDFTIKKKRLEYAAIAAGILFLATVFIQIVGIILGT